MIPDFKTALLTHIPSLRAFGRALCADGARADDLVQETLLRAWSNRTSFTLGTNMKAWLFTILRNAFYSDVRRRSREVEDPDGINARNLTVEPSQDGELDLRDLRRALARLPEKQREAILLVGASGCSYEEAAAICECAVGTIKSRVSRARVALLAQLNIGEAAAGALPGVLGSDGGGIIDADSDELEPEATGAEDRGGANLGERAGAGLSSIVRTRER